MSNTMIVNDKELLLDKEGFLENLEDWNPEVAAILAQHEEVELTEAHWEIINIARKFYDKRGLSPVIRILVKLVYLALGSDKGNSLYLLSLFPESPAKMTCKIAGLPRPVNCI